MWVDAHPHIKGRGRRQLSSLAVLSWDLKLADSAMQAGWPVSNSDLSACLHILNAHTWLLHGARDPTSDPHAV